MLWILFSLLAVDSTNLEAILTLDSLPGSSETFFERPADIAFDKDGNIYVLDVKAKKVFTWDSAGGFLGSYGSSGQAPGEFVFFGHSSRGVGFINVMGQQVYIYDGAKREVSVYGLGDLSFRKNLSFKRGVGSQVIGFWAITPNRFLFHERSFEEELVRILDAEAGVVTTLAQNKVMNMRIEGANDASGKRRRHPSSVTVIGFAPTTVAGFNSALGQIQVGHGDTAFFQTYDTQGKQAGKLKLKIPRLEVSKKDMKEYSSQAMFAKTSFYKADYADNKAYYEYILSTGDKGYLVYNASPIFKDMAGYVINPKGEVESRFSYHCGENGDLLGSQGRVFAVNTSEEGAFTLQELRVPGK